MISGYSAGFSYPTDDLLKFIRNKLFRLAIPYAIWAEIYMMISWAMGYEKISIKTILLCLETSPFWFLRHLIIYFIVLWMANILLCILKPIIKSSKIYMVLSCLFPVGGAGVIYLLKWTPWLNQTNALWQYLWFVLGYFLFVICKHIHNDRYIYNRGVLVISIIGIIVVYFCFKKIGMNEYVTCTIATTMMMLLFGNLGNFSKKYKYSRYIEEIGRSTLPIYAIHWCILFAPNLNQNMYTRILNEDYYIFNVFFTCIIWLGISILGIRILRKTKVTKILFLGEK